MKRAKDLYQKLISDENLRLAILTVNATHKWHPHHRPNKTVLRVEADIDGYVEKLREIIVNGYDAAPPRIARRWDKSAGKWRDISEPRLWPDQFYDSLTIETVMARLRRLVKDRRMLDVCERLMKYGVLIGAFFSQWFANTVLQPLDQMIRNSGLCDHYMRYMDNLTLFGRNKRKLRKLRGMIEDWLAGRRLKLNNKWQLYPTAKRTVAALGYRFGHKFSLLRKRNMVRLKKSLSECYRAMRKHQKIRPKLAQGLLSRLGQMKHCNHVHFFEKYVETGLQRKLKLVVKEHTRKEQARWNMCTEPLKSTA